MRLFGHCVLLFLWATGCGRDQGSEAPPPNIIFILTDDQSFRAIGYHNPEVKTPHLDTLASQGVIFQQAYVATPICAASRASILTGLFPQQHGVIALDSKNFMHDVVRDSAYALLPQLLNERGYTTVFYGKSHLGNPTDYGFQQGRQIRADDEVFAAAQRFVSQARADEAPFFLWLATHQPHLPLQPPNSWLAQYDTADIILSPNFRESPLVSSLFNQGLPHEHYFRDSDYTDNVFGLPSGPPRSSATVKQFTRAYYATISHLDEQIGALFTTLEKEGLAEQTVIIFLSDNGYLVGNHGLGNKITMHEESTRVPMFVWGVPSGLPGRRSDALVSSLDVYSTVLDLAEVPIPDYVMGRSLLPLLRRPAEAGHPYVVSECVGVGGQRGEGHRMVRSGPWKYMLSGINEEGLYYLNDDPYETNNLVDEPRYANQLRTMRGYLTEWMAQVQDTHARPPQKP